MEKESKTNKLCSLLYKLQVKVFYNLYIMIKVRERGQLNNFLKFLKVFSQGLYKSSFRQWIWDWCNRISSKSKRIIVSWCVLIVLQSFTHTLLKITKSQDDCYLHPLLLAAVYFIRIKGKVSFLFDETSMRCCLIFI